MRQSLQSIRPQEVHIYLTTDTLSLAKIDHYGLAMDIRMTLADLQAENATAFRFFKSDDVVARATIIDITHDFCRDNICEVTKNGKPLFFERSHLSKAGSIGLVPSLSAIFNGLDEQTFSEAAKK
jgi:hypothetical protein